MRALSKSIHFPRSAHLLATVAADLPHWSTTIRSDILRFVHTFAAFRDNQLPANDTDTLDERLQTMGRIRYR